MNSIRHFVIIAAALAATTSGLALSAEAQGRTRESKITTDGGREVESRRSVQRQDGATSRETSVQGSGGRGFTGQSQSGYDAEAQERYRSGSVTTNSGKTASRDKTVGCADGRCTTGVELVGPNGQTATRGTERYIDENGNYVKDTEVTGPDGSTAGRSVSRDGEGTKTTTRTNRDGEDSTRTRWVTVDKD